MSDRKKNVELNKGQLVCKLFGPQQKKIKSIQCDSQKKKKNTVIYNFMNLKFIKFKIDSSLKQSLTFLVKKIVGQFIWDLFNIRL